VGVHRPELTLFEAIRTLRAVREFTAEPVSEEMLRTILDLAVCAPNGGNGPATRRTSGPKVRATPPYAGLGADAR
jgi:nitroreductase